MKTRSLLILAICLLVCSTGSVNAQDEAQGWPIEERCVGEATDPPEGWRFPGAILLRSYDSLYAIEHEQEAPVLLVTDDDGRLGSGALSPDERWYAVTQDEHSYDDPWDLIHTSEIRVYSTSDPEIAYVLPWENTHSIRWASGFGVMSQEQTLRWRDNQHLMFEQGGTVGERGDIVLIDPFQNEVTVWSEPWLADANPLHPDGFFYPSPDWTRAIWEDYPEGGYILHNLETDERNILEDDVTLFRAQVGGAIAWRPDSSGFTYAFHFWDEVSFFSALRLADEDGEYLDTIAFFRFGYDSIGSLGGLTYYDSRNWSPSGRYFAFRSFERVPDSNQLQSANVYIADIHERILVDPCVNLGGRLSLAWSPDSSMLALTADGEGHRPVQILDIENWQLYTVAHHDGQIIGWRADE